MEKFSYRCGAVTLQFGVSEEGCPCLLYAGTYPAARREEEALGRYVAEFSSAGKITGSITFPSITAAAKRLRSGTRGTAFRRMRTEKN